MFDRGWFRLNWTIIRGTARPEREGERRSFRVANTNRPRISRKYAGKETNRAAIQSKLRAWILTNGGRPILYGWLEISNRFFIIQTVARRKIQSVPAASPPNPLPYPRCPLFPYWFSCFCHYAGKGNFPGSTAADVFITKRIKLAGQRIGNKTFPPASKPPPFENKIPKYLPV